MQMTRNRNSRTPDTQEEKRKIDKSSLKKLLGIYQFMIPYRTSFFAGLVSLLFSSTVLLAFPYFTGKLVDTSVGESEWILEGIDQIALALVAVLVVQSLFSFLKILFFARVSEQAMADIRKKLYEKYMTLPLHFYDNRRSGELISRITSDVTLLQDTFTVTLSEFIRQVSILVIGIGILFATTPQLTFFMLGTFPLLVVAGMLFGRLIRKLSRKTQDALADANIVVEETLQAVSIVKAFTNEIFEIARYRRSMNKVVGIALKAAVYRGAFVSFVIFALFGGIVLVLWYGARLVNEGAITIGELTSFIIYTMFIGGSIGGLGNIYGALQKAIGATERVLEITDEQEEWDPQSGEDQQELPIKGEIRMERVDFTYPSRKNTQVLKKIELKIADGEKVALVGHSGAGKSTVIQALLRFYPLQDGQILVDGKNIEDYPLLPYRSNIAIVPQEVILFGGTIRENIAYGKPEATEEEVREAARKANALGFIEGFPEKFETVVGERGVKLSGGQKQRVAIARAILKDPAILVLDEATSSLDAESEALVQAALDELMVGRTTIIIAHRLATIRKVDRIYVLDQGAVVETGTHEELAMVENGIYSNLIKLQFDFAGTDG